MPRPIEVPANLLWKRDLRLWRERETARHAALERILGEDAIRELARDFTLRWSDKGRLRALLKLRRLLDDYAFFDAARTHDGPMVAWAAIHPHDGNWYDTGEADIEYVIIRGGRVLRNLWNARFLPHALERLAQRNPPGTDLTAAVISAHRSIVKGRIAYETDGVNLYIPAATGRFKGELIKTAGRQFALLQTFLGAGLVVDDDPETIIAPAVPARPAAITGKNAGFRSLGEHMGGHHPLPQPHASAAGLNRHITIKCLQSLELPWLARRGP